MTEDEQIQVYNIIKNITRNKNVQQDSIIFILSTYKKPPTTKEIKRICNRFKRKNNYYYKRNKKVMPINNIFLERY